MAPKQPKKKENPIPPTRFAANIAGKLLVIGVAVGIPGYIFLSALFAADQLSLGKLLPHTYIGAFDVSGKTYDAAREALQARVDEIALTGMTLAFQGEQFTVETTLTDEANPEIAYPLVTYDVDATMDEVLSEQAVLSPLDRGLRLLFSDITAPVVTIDNETLMGVLEKELGSYETPAQNASVVFSGETPTLKAEQSGMAFEYGNIVNDIVAQFALLIPPAREVSLVQDEPDIRMADVQDLLPSVQTIVASGPYVLSFEGSEWKLESDVMRSALAFYRREGEGDQATSGDGTVLGTQQEVAIGVAGESIETWLDAIAAEISRPAQEAKFEMQNGRVTVFQPSKNGVALNMEKTLAALNGALAGGGATVEIAVNETAPEIKTDEVNTLGITELVGMGKTNFAGSPKNRRFNIGLAAEKLNGILIAPGETFSLVKALSPIDKANGYLPELVIKGNRTIPEVGGGLCQIGTTFFRLVLDSGLPVVERKNHSYRVSYYEPPVGMDATIYDPKPDFRFTNDFTTNLLLQTYVDGDNLIFEFYGTKDGRSASSSAPKIYNVVRPGPTKIIETTDLAPGARKCIEKAHNGSDADFTYSVTYPDGTVRSEVFKSHYKAWPEVCLVGVVEKSPDTQDTELENVKTELAD
ncbi:MAG: VanW family protein [Parcubacteria group bacterium]